MVFLSFFFFCVMLAYQTHFSMKRRRTQEAAKLFPILQTLQSFFGNCSALTPQGRRMPRRKAGTSLPVARRATTIRWCGASGTPPPTTAERKARPAARACAFPTDRLNCYLLRVCFAPDVGFFLLLFVEKCRMIILMKK